MADPTRLLDDRAASSTTLDLLRTLQPPQAAAPAVKAALAGQLSTLAAQGTAKAAAGALWLKATLLSVAVAGSGAAIWKLVPSEQVVPARAVSAPVALSAPLATLPAPSPPPSAAPAPNAEPKSAAPVVTSSPRDKLAEEEALLEQARAQLRQNPSRALGLLRRHQSQFPGGQLAAERMFLSVDCLSRLGMRTQAEREVKALVQRYPTSAYARRAPLLLASPSR